MANDIPEHIRAKINAIWDARRKTLDDLVDDLGHHIEHTFARGVDTEELEGKAYIKGLHFGMGQELMRQTARLYLEGQAKEDAILAEWDARTDADKDAA